LPLTEAFAVERWVNLGGGKGCGVREEGGDDGSREDAPIFEIDVDNRGEEGAGFAPGGLLDAY
jgi:hypothetical protein